MQRCESGKLGIIPRTAENRINIISKIAT